MSLTTYSIRLQLSALIKRKNWANDSFVRSCATNSRRRPPSLIWYTRVRYLCPFFHAISSMPIAVTFSHELWAIPHITAYRTLRKTVCHDV